jgi:hypothetical protein
VAKFKWTIEIEVDEVWIADGFDLTDDIANRMVLRELNYADEHEVTAKVVKSPSVESVRKAQGYYTRG